MRIARPLSSARLAAFAFLALGSVALAGCPIYDDSGGDFRVCDGQTCYDCPSNYYSSACAPWGCYDDYDCPGSYACNQNGACVGSGGGTLPDGGPLCLKPSDCAAGQTCGADNQCHTSTDCAQVGCPVNFACKLDETTGDVSCVPFPNGAPDGGLPDSSGPDTGPPDAGPGFTGCQQDVECADAGAGARCLDGTCVAAADLCFDGTQCPAGDQCVQGACTPTCDGSHACQEGYTCDLAKGICQPGATGCENGVSPCASGKVCAQNACVDACDDVDGSFTCPSGYACIQGGCVIDQKPTFTCVTEGVKDACAQGSICLHHSCYIGCDPDAGTDGGSCQNADQFNVCKGVSTGGSTYDVCGSSANLGTECNPTSGQNCSTPGDVCIDGFCR
jgi:hypothetical protein